MSFVSWLKLNEMPHFSVGGKMSIPCGAVKAGAGGLDMPCVDKPVGAIDLLGNKALQMGYLPEEPGDGHISEKGYIQAPKDWFIYAYIFDTDYNVIKPPLSIVTGKRDA